MSLPVRKETRVEAGEIRWVSFVCASCSRPIFVENDGAINHREPVCADWPYPPNFHPPEEAT